MLLKCNFTDMRVFQICIEFITVDVTLLVWNMSALVLILKALVSVKWTVV